MSFLLDTDTCSAHVKGDRRLWHKFMQHGGGLHVSTITVGELFTWASRKGVSVKRRIVLQNFFDEVVILEVNRSIAEKFGELRAQFLDVGLRMPEMDLIIASTAIVHDLTLITHNTQDFTKVPGLRMQDWLAA